jgi:two-component system LytT family response regulator
MYKVIIADDENLARKRLTKLLSVFPNITVIAQASNGTEAWSLVQEHSPDFIFLDIEMPGMTGIEVAKKMGISSTKIIFVTAYDQYALEAFETNTYDYLVKPIDEDRLLITYNKLFNTKAEDSTSIVVKQGNKTSRIALEKIICISAAGPYCNVSTNEGEFLVSETLDFYENILPKAMFLRIHRSTIVSITRISQFKRLGDRKYILSLLGLPDLELKVARNKIAILKSLIEK